MDNKSAAKYLKDHFNPDYPSSSGIQHDEAINTAIRVLEENVWKDVTDESPTFGVPVLLGIRDGNNYTCIVTTRINRKFWEYVGSEIVGELKWHKLPLYW